MSITPGPENKPNGIDTSHGHMGHTSSFESEGSRQKNDVLDLGKSGRNEAEKHSEGMVAKTIEQQTAKLPSDTFLWAAIGAMAASATCELMGYKDKSRFFGQWAAPFLLFGVYNKIVKTQGSDRTEH